MNHIELKQYAAVEVEKIVAYFKDRELTPCKIGCLNITNPQLMVETNIGYIQNYPHTSKVFVSSMRRLKWYKEQLEHEITNNK